MPRWLRQPRHGSLAWYCPFTLASGSDPRHESRVAFLALAVALVVRQLEALEVPDVLRRERVLARTLDQQPAVARRRLPSLRRHGRSVRERRDPVLAAVGDGHAEPLVHAEMHQLGAVQVVEFLGRQQVEHAPRPCGDVRQEVSDTAFAGTDRDVEAETVALEAAAAGGERMHAAALEEDRAVRVAAVGEVPESVRHALTSAEIPRWRRYMSMTQRYAG